jgi:hypothetical protein
VFSSTRVFLRQSFYLLAPARPSLAKGRRALFTVVVATAFVMTPLILGGALLGFYVGGAVGYPGSILAIAFSTVGFVVGMAIIFWVIKEVVSWADRTTG